MTIRVLEDGHGLEKGIRVVTDDVARDLISKGIAVRIKEKAIDKDANNALQQARLRDGLQDS